MTLIELARKLRPIIEQAAQSLDDVTALQAVELHPHWMESTTYEVGYKVQYAGKLWRCMQAHISQIDWTPDVAASLFEQIDETHAGTLADPIPYDGNMALVNGLYYSQDGVVYLCIRDTVNPVYHPLSDLVGIYVEQADN